VRLSKKAAPEKSAIENKGLFRGNYGDPGFFDSLNEAVHVTAARVQFGMKLKGLVWAAARDGGR
jgi:hypothetical protein